MDSWFENLRREYQQNVTEWDEEQSLQERMMSDFFTFWPSKPEKKRRRVFREGRRIKDRGRERGHEQLFKDYFATNSTYTDEDFRRRNRMSKRLFSRIMADLKAHDPYFEQHRDAANKLGLSTLQKMTAAIRQLAYGIGADATDEYCRIGESTARESLYRFCRAIREMYEEHYLRKPTTEDLGRVLNTNESRGFPGLFGSLDCMHYEWSNCPVAWQAAYGNKKKEKTIVLEAVADGELRFWHAFFGLPGANNDLNVLDRSPLLNDFITGAYNEVRYELDDQIFDGPYLLVDGIYRPLSCFVKTIAEPNNAKTRFFAKMQEAIRKDVERAFGILQGRWGILTQAARPWHLSKIIDILMCTVILHNRILEDERGEEHEEDFYVPPVCPQNVPRTELRWGDYMESMTRIEDRDLNAALRNCLIEHLWNWKGGQENS